MKHLSSIVTLLLCVQISQTMDHAHGFALPPASSKVVLPQSTPAQTLLCGICDKKDSLDFYWPHKNGNGVHEECLKKIEEFQEPIVVTVQTYCDNVYQQQCFMRIFAEILQEVCKPQSIKQYIEQKGPSALQRLIKLRVANDLCYSALRNANDKYTEMNALDTKMQNIPWQGTEFYHLSNKRDALQVEYRKLLRFATALSTMHDDEVTKVIDEL